MVSDDNRRRSLREEATRRKNIGQVLIDPRIRKDQPYRRDSGEQPHIKINPISMRNSEAPNE